MFNPKIQNFLYQNIAKPIFFKIDPELTHNLATWAGQVLGSNFVTRSLTGRLLLFSDKSLEQNILRIDFKNPIGLAAGFDYDSKLINILPAVGFGFHTAGTITNRPYVGNEKPRLGRLQKSQSLLVNKGFKSAGMDINLQRIKKSIITAPLGISIGSTNMSYDNFENQIADVILGFKKAITSNLGDYYELNISCPNLTNTGKDAESFSTPVGLKNVLQALSSLDFKKPVFIKMHLDKTDEETKALLDVAEKFYFIKGCILSNLCKDRSNPAFNKHEVETAGKGNFSGKPTFKKSNKLISFVYKNYKDRFIIIGVGGIFSAEDAYAKIKSGASLIQMITGMIYEGPQIIGQINKGLADLIKRDGYSNISEAIGANHR